MAYTAGMALKWPREIGSQIRGINLNRVKLVGGYLIIGYLIFLVVIYVVALGGCWLMTVLGLPGNWLMAPLALGFDWLLQADSRMKITWPLIIGMLILAIIGEGLEFAAGAAGVAKKGGSRLSAFLALVGSGIGGIVGAVVGLPAGLTIPVVGSVIAVILCASIGALIGAVIGEDWGGRDIDGSIEIGMAAFWGRLLGTLAKTLIGGVIVAVGLAGLIV